METKVKDLMGKDPKIISADTTLKEVAETMEELDCGVLPIGSDEDLEGIITDRDIVIRAVSQGKDVTTEKVRDYMTPEVVFCDEDDSIISAAKKMRDNQVNRLVVKNQENKITGILTFGCILRKDENMQEVGQIIEDNIGNKAA